MPTTADPLAGWTAAPFAAAGVTHDVYTRGEGPGVVLLPEIPEGLCPLGLRFSEDSGSPKDRFTALGEAFGPGWRAIPLDSRPGNPAGIGKREHSVLTSADVERPGHPTHEARAEVTAFLQARLGLRAG